MLVDLHTHTSCSDGLLSERLLVKYARFNNVKFLSITDHNYFSYREELVQYAKRLGIRLIPGVEYSTKENLHKAHILGYGIEELHPRLNEYSFEYKEQKTAQTREMCLRSVDEPLIIGQDRKIEVPIELLGEGKENKFVYSWSEFFHIMPEIYRKIKRENDPSMDEEDAAGLMVGSIKSYKKFKDTFVNLRKGERLWRSSIKIDYISTKEVIQCILESGGIPVLAHPKEHKFYEPGIKELQNSGLQGLEVFTQKNRDRYDYYLDIANRLNLAISGGTDFHYPSLRNRMGQILKRDVISPFPEEEQYLPIKREMITVLSKLI
ncbi:PHP domain-containing protein [archaeon]|jgi:predicted metal-dependent phosphoesterase TrpH|nr:PHP domain-containing protein [archaeon]MBT3450932.1 PHP domain-containing protein [archaeon]MBT6869578.1 PHP domain-containing protein [archaeon]MBT7193430.1 PHP domain-containing protein [archaeon]MBT7381021.1 PHP domain-containing protein [archaeon]